MNRKCQYTRVFASIAAVALIASSCGSDSDSSSDTAAPGTQATVPADTEPTDTAPAGTEPADTAPDGTEPTGTEPADTAPDAAGGLLWRSSRRPVSRS